MPANTRFTEGRITTLKVPVKLSHPKESDALSFITFDKNSTRKEVIINGEKINTYVLHQTEKTVQTGFLQWEKQLVGHTIDIKGNVKELLNALDAGFYASTWEGRPSAMTVSNINLWINGTQFINYKPLLDALQKNLAAQPGLGQIVAALWGLAKYAVIGMFENGIARDGDISLTKFMDPSNITFTGIVSNGAEDSEGLPSLFFLDDGQLHKLVGKEKVDQLLRTKFDFKTDLGEVLIPTYDGLMDIVNKSSNSSPSTEAIRTARAIYGKLKSTVGSVSADFAGMEIKAWDIFQALFPDELALINMLPTLTISVTIEVYPYTNVTNGYGSKGSPKRPDPGVVGDKSDDLNPIIFWGFDQNCD